MGGTLKILYGLKACDTSRNAAKALEQAGLEVQFRDVRADPLSPAELRRFGEAFGDALVNRRSTTWRELPESERGRNYMELLADHPTLMKRPVIRGAQLTLGWDKAAQAAQGL